MDTLALIKPLFRLPLTSGLITRLIKLAYIKGERSLQRFLDFLLWQLRAAFNRERPVVWVSVFTPSEIIYALDMIPFYPEVMAGLLASLGKSGHCISLAEGNFYSTDLCSFYRTAIGAAFQGYFPKPDLLISTSYLCDGTVKSFHNLSQYYNCDHLLLDPPHRQDREARDYLASQIEELMEKIGKPIDRKRIAHVFELSNKMREYRVKINQLRRNIPSPLSGWDALGHILIMNFCSPGSRWGVSFYRTLYEEVKQRVRTRGGVVEKERSRLLWLHHIRPYYKTNIWDCLRQRGAVIAFEETSHVHWEPLDPDRPFESLADKIISNFDAGPIERRQRAVLDWVGRYQIDGVIHFSHWGCRQSCGGAHMIKDFLQQEGVPLLILNGDGADARNYSPEQTRTRLEAFLEMLG